MTNFLCRRAGAKSRSLAAVHDTLLAVLFVLFHVAGASSLGPSLALGYFLFVSFQLGNSLTVPAGTISVAHLVCSKLGWIQELAEPFPLLARFFCFRVRS